MGWFSKEVEISIEEKIQNIRDSILFYDEIKTCASKQEMLDKKKQRNEFISNEEIVQFIKETGTLFEASQHVGHLAQYKEFEQKKFIEDQVKADKIFQARQLICSNFNMNETVLDALLLVIKGTK